MQNNKLLLKTNNLNLQNDLSKKINLPNLNKDSFKISTKNKWCLTLSFLSLPVIPEIKITDKGLFDVTNFKFIPICE